MSLVNIEENGYISPLEAWDEGRPIDPTWLVRPANPLTGLISHLEEEAGRPFFPSSRMRARGSATEPAALRTPSGLLGL